MNVRIIDEATAEFVDAVARYELIEAGLGMRLSEEVKSAITWISNQPELPRIRPKGYRRVNLKIFPYYIAYIIHLDEIWILAIAHSARLPDYWVARGIK